jgi:hypothetical protein
MLGFVAFVACSGESLECDAGTHEDDGACVSDARDEGDADTDSDSDSDTDTDTDTATDVPVLTALLVYPCRDGTTVSYGTILVQDPGLTKVFAKLTWDSDETRALGVALEPGEYRFVFAISAGSSTSKGDASATLTEDDYYRVGTCGGPSRWLPVEGKDWIALWVEFEAGLTLDYTASILTDAGYTIAATTTKDSASYIVTWSSGVLDALSRLASAEPNPL